MTDDRSEEEPEDRSEEGPELARLRGDGPGAGTAPSTGFVVTWRGRHDRPEVALARLRELLLTAVPLMGDHEDDAALAALPAWFVQQCSTPTAKWSAEGWLFWLEPDERSWWWWGGRADGPDQLVVEVLTHGHPYGSGSLRWMLRAVGCADLTEDGRSVDHP